MYTGRSCAMYTGRSCAMYTARIYAMYTARSCAMYTRRSCAMYTARSCATYTARIYAMCTDCSSTSHGTRYDTGMVGGSSADCGAGMWLSADLFHVWHNRRCKRSDCDTCIASCAKPCKNRSPGILQERCVSTHCATLPHRCVTNAVLLLLTLHILFFWDTFIQKILFLDSKNK